MPHVEQVPVILKRSAVPGKVPTVGDLQYGELAINYADGIVRFKTSTNEIAELAQARKTLTPTWSSVMSIDLMAGRVDLIRITLGGPTTELSFTNAVDGQKFIVELTQGTGNNAVTFGNDVRITPSMSMGLLFSETLGEMDKLGFMYHVNTYDLIAISLGYTP